MTEERRRAIALSYLPGVGPIRARKLVARGGGFVGALELAPAELAELGIPARAIEQIADGTALRSADRELRFVEEHGIAVIDCLDADYPRRLAEHPDAPVVLYYRGVAPLDAPRTVGIVGTRKPSPAGVAFCERLVDQLREYRVTTVSGLAYGIDIAAHKASLAAGIPTIGVLAHGLAEIYPTAHRDTAKAMSEAGGLLTEYPSGMRSRREFFPMRNRVIAGLCDALVVVESASKGGSMITANLAVGYNTPMFAVPGRPKDPMSAGCNELIKNHRAHLLQSADDIGYIMNWKPNDAGQPTGRANQLFQTYEPDEQRVVDALRDGDDVDIDTLTFEVGMAGSTLAAVLLGLEFKGVVRSLPGKRYALA